MAKNTYEKPEFRIIDLCVEGIIAASSRIPVKDEPNAPATKHLDSPWSSSQWSEDEFFD